MFLFFRKPWKVFSRLVAASALKRDSNPGSNALCLASRVGDGAQILRDFLFFFAIENCLYESSG